MFSDDALSGQFGILRKGHCELLRRSALRQQLCHDHKPLIAAVGLVVLSAAGGEGQNGIFLGEGHTVNKTITVRVFS